MPMIRQPFVAGKFYPSNPKDLKQLIGSFLTKQNLKRKEVIGCLLPHAGYIYSGTVAIQVISEIVIKNNIIILGPNHSGFGEAFSIITEGSWLTPLGTVNINSKLAQSILKHSSLLRQDTQAHQFEHSIEVELPILQYFKADFSFVPIVIASNNFNDLKLLGNQIADTIEESGLAKDTIILASSDMTHYEDYESAKEKDGKAIKAMIELDEVKLLSVVNTFDISMCGYAPTIVMLCAAKRLGAKWGQLVKYQTSKEASGDSSSVVGYAGITVG